MKLFFSTALLICFFISGIFAQASRWHTYLTHNTYTQIVEHADRIFLLADGNLYSTSLNEAFHNDYSYSRLSGLSNNYIHSIVSSQDSHSMTIVYQDGDIDIIDSLLFVHNLPDFKSKSLLGSRTIQRVSEANGEVRVCGDFGYFCIDTYQYVISHSFLSDEPVYSYFNHNGTRYYSSPSGTYRSTDLNTTVSKWAKFSDDVVLDAFSYTAADGSKMCWIRTLDNRLCWLDTDQTFKTFCGCFNFLSVQGQYLYSCSGNGPQRLDLESRSIARPDVRYHPQTVGIIQMSDSTLLCLDNKQGLILANIDSIVGSTIVYSTTHEQKLDGGTANPFCAQMAFHDGHLCTAASGHFNLHGTSKMSALEPMLSVYYPETDHWDNLDLYGLHPQTKGIISFVHDLKRPDRFYFGTLGKGLFVVSGDTLEAHYTPENSPIANVTGLNNYYRVGGTFMDQSGYLWLANCNTDTVLCSISPDGQWRKYPIEGFWGDNTAMITRIVEGKNDPYHFKWLLDAGNTGCHTAMYYDAGTPEDLSDDESIYFSALTDQDGNVINPHYMHDIVEDLDGKIWLMTSSGPFVIDRPIDCFNTPGLVRRIKIPRNDGTNLADYLLPDVDCICCVVDAANRKWIGTNGNGLYCISADGLKQIENFTTDNSPLLANDILALAYDDETGTLYISCEGGILSYTTDAIRGEEDFDNVYCYPNPVRPDYTGDLVIRGLLNDSQVTITDATGHVVYRGQSAGGSLSWDLTSTSGRRVASGVYLIVATDADGKEGIVSRFLVLK